MGDYWENSGTVLRVLRESLENIGSISGALKCTESLRMVLRVLEESCESIWRVLGKYWKSP